MVRAVVNSRIFAAEIEQVKYTAEIVRPELGYIFLSIVFFDIMVMI